MFGAYLRGLREAADLSAHEAGAQSGVSYKTIKRWERGGNPESLNVLVAYVQFLKGSVLRIFSYLLTTEIDEEAAKAAATHDRQVRNSAELERQITTQIASLSGARRDTAIQVLEQLLAAEAQAQK